MQVSQVQVAVGTVQIPQVSLIEHIEYQLSADTDSSAVQLLIEGGESRDDISTPTRVDKERREAAVHDVHVLPEERQRSKRQRHSSQHRSAKQQPAKQAAKEREERVKGRKGQRGRGQEGRKKEEREAEEGGGELVEKDATVWTEVTRNKREKMVQIFVKVDGMKTVAMEVSPVEQGPEDPEHREWK